MTRLKTALALILSLNAYNNSYAGHGKEVDDRPEQEIQDANFAQQTQDQLDAEARSIDESATQILAEQLAHEAHGAGGAAYAADKTAGGNFILYDFTSSPPTPGCSTSTSASEAEYAGEEVCFSSSPEEAVDLSGELEANLTATQCKNILLQLNTPRIISKGYIYALLKYAHTEQNIWNSNSCRTLEDTESYAHTLLSLSNGFLNGSVDLPLQESRRSILFYVNQLNGYTTHLSAHFPENAPQKLKQKLDLARISLCLRYFNDFVATQAENEQEAKKQEWLSTLWGEVKEILDNKGVSKKYAASLFSEMFIHYGFQHEELNKKATLDLLQKWLTPEESRRDRQRSAAGNTQATVLFADSRLGWVKEQEMAHLRAITERKRALEASEQVTASSDSDAPSAGRDDNAAAAAAVVATLEPEKSSADDFSDHTENPRGEKRGRDDDAPEAEEEDIPQGGYNGDLDLTSSSDVEKEAPTPAVKKRRLVKTIGNSKRDSEDFDTELDRLLDEDLAEVDDSASASAVPSNHARKTHKYLSTEEVRKVQDLHSRGMSCKEMSIKLGVSLSSISWRLKKLELTPNHHKVYSQQEIDFIKKYHQKGFDVPQIQRAHEQSEKFPPRTKGSLYALMRSLGLPQKRVLKIWTLDDDKKLQNLQRSGVSYEEMAQELKRTRKSIVHRIFILNKK